MNFCDIDWKYNSVKITTNTAKNTNSSRQSKTRTWIKTSKGLRECQNHDEPSLLDLLLTDKTLEASNIEYFSPLGKGDYALIQVKFKFRTEN